MTPNFGGKETVELTAPDMIFAIEPIINEGSKEVLFNDAGDGYTVFSKRRLS